MLCHWPSAVEEPVVMVLKILGEVNPIRICVYKPAPSALMLLYNPNSLLLHQCLWLLVDSIISIVYMGENATATVCLHLSHIGHDVVVAVSIAIVTEFVCGWYDVISSIVYEGKDNDRGGSRYAVSRADIY